MFANVFDLDPGPEKAIMDGRTRRGEHALDPETMPATHRS